MGLAILPLGLKNELAEVEKYCLNQYNEFADCHKFWTNEVKKAQTLLRALYNRLYKDAVGQIFVRIVSEINAVGKLSFKTACLKKQNFSRLFRCVAFLSI
ncbi:hypothetical protein BMI76_03360 [Streptococcus sp. 'caviae']|nr:hypothetical protein BMI76_03360 [Streptococcus sp. 'caviae']